MTTPVDPFKLRPIGVVRSPFATTHEIPFQGGPATLELDPAFEAGLLGLERSSHLVVLGLLHRADRTLLRTRPRKLDAQAPEQGVFSTRSPARPNPISLTVVPLLGRDGRSLRVDHLDLVDGTPLVDLKSYSPAWDGIFAASHRHRVATARLDDARLLACFERDLQNFMGGAAAREEARLVLAALFVAIRAGAIEPRDPGLRLRMNRGGLEAEAAMALTGASASNERLAASQEAGPLRIELRFGDRLHVLEHLAGRLPPAPLDWACAFRQEVRS